MITLEHKPIEWYIECLHSCTPFASLLYGDGEFYVADRSRTHHVMQYQEIITKDLENEMLASLECSDPRIVRGTDLNLICYDDYQGQDRASIVEIGKRIHSVIDRYNLTWVDGVIWEDAMREGRFAPILKALKPRRIHVIGNARLLETIPIHCISHTLIRDHNATAAMYATIKKTIKAIKSVGNPKDVVFIVCAGLSAIPIIIHLLREDPSYTFLDLGSIFDIFFRGSPERGWRSGLYLDEEAYKDLIRRNTEGV